MPSSSVVNLAAQANLALLEQGRELIRRLGPARYATAVDLCFNSSAGGHFRHAIEHCLALLTAVETGSLDYENRARDHAIETDAERAIAALGRIETGLRQLIEGAAPDRALLMAAETVEGATMTTSLERELEFLISHTVHHYALIAVIARAQGVVPPAEFGMAPSTLKFRASQGAACAR